ncbi:zinc-dependent alcohol dehydrogenase family protein [Actinokineospora auranticolor]|uniref:D-arabinose 1-dehydrogenase-like Zn-dependent alcohol dehydrogenase n=1 Tax=Actinokineospora auranticolor TaxID=155976 RepID=A0A2S6GET7_9PSEU|nr:zinc-dependent alcohol dehydrogenase family protein [Actinokineospora auranticolor]PPK63626.1 D-arabinose 1-dehydrogenase-like Zn-dependent alcohol dehydrogenase [Actinokineospora auranticolor]
MRAVVFEQFGQDPKVETVPDPAPSTGGVVIRVAATGLCRSDWHGWIGHDPDIRLPHVPGHELAGTIAAVGPGVTRWREGDRVTVPFVCACGRCPACAAGDQQVCERQTQPGFTHWGSFAEYVAVEDAEVNLVGLAADIPFATAAGLGCRVATAFRAVLAQGRVAAGEWVAVHGCGGVGLSSVAVAIAAGARVVAVDISQTALDLAAGLGAVCLNPVTTVDIPAAVRDLTGGGAHVSLDCLGSPATCAASILSLRRRGRHVQVGLLPKDPLVPMARVIAYELSVLGSHGMPAHAYPEMMAMVSAGTLRPADLITRTIALDDAPNALTAMGNAPGTGVTMITP